MVRQSNLEHLERYPLSVIASFLTEIEGTCFFLSKKIWAKTLLPIFRIPAQQRRKNQSESDHLLTREKKYRHRFVVVPVQDATTRLARLNTRRWKKQKLKCAGMSTEDYAHSGQDVGYPPILRFYRTSDSVFKSGTTVLASYPRSGNTLLRSLLESITGYVTGSDTRPDRTLSMALADRHGLVGEGLILPRQAAIVKTHWPERIGYRGYRAHRAIILVRNPFDAIDSYWNLNVTNTHTEKVTEEVYQHHETFFTQLALNEIKVWMDFLEFWNSQQAPLLWVRYEDLVQNTEDELLRILSFSMCNNNNNEDEWLERVKFVLQREGHGYRSLSTQTSDSALPYGRSLRRYSLELLHQMHNLDRHGWLEKLGYHVFVQDFPQNVLCGKLPPLPSTQYCDSEINVTSKGGLQINQPVELELRTPRCSFGRNMREWRRKHTKNDTEPFPTTRVAGRQMNKSTNN